MRTGDLGGIQSHTSVGDCPLQHYGTEKRDMSTAVVASSSSPMSESSNSSPAPSPVGPARQHQHSDKQLVAAEAAESTRLNYLEGAENGTSSHDVAGNSGQVRALEKTTISQHCHAESPSMNGGLHDAAAAAFTSGYVPSNPPSTTSSAPQTSTTSKDERKNGDRDPLTTELRNILIAVAQTGTCAWLPWAVDEGGGSTGIDALGGTGNAIATAAATQLKVPLPVSAATVAAAAAAAAVHHQQRSGQQHQQQQHHTSKQNHSSYRRSTASTSGQPPRKKHRNGLHNSVRKTKRRFGDAAAVSNAAAPGSASGTGGRKRPLFLIRTSSSSANTPSVFSPGSVGSGPSVGSGRTSGSEPEDMDTSQYDSEGTSATSNSDLSFERNLRNRVPRSSFVALTAVPLPAEEQMAVSTFKCQKDAFRAALKLVLDHFYQSRGGYTLSPAEKRRNATLITQTVDPGVNRDDSSAVERLKLGPTIYAEEIFRQRRQRLLSFLEPATVDQKQQKMHAELPQSSSNLFREDGPPFTLQRIAEVLISPERYYTQTHKLCNCLEKLLLITSSANAFGGIYGGDTSQSRLEERELAALAEEQGRLQSEFRQRRLKHHHSAIASEDSSDNSTDHGSGRRYSGSGEHSCSGTSSRSSTRDNADGIGSDQDTPSSDASDAASRELLEAAARASLRTKFDHVGIDPHSCAVVNRDVRSIAENRGMTNSPPPPSLSMSAAALPGHSGLLRHDHPSSPPGGRDHPSGLTRVPSPILFNHGNEHSSPPMGPMHANSSNMHLLQIQHQHHNPSLSGVSHFELASLNHSTEAGSPSTSAPGLTSMTAKDPDLESRSSASSDVDSESDVSFDDSASDRSDGSDSGHFEPFSAARAMALNRMQQQRMQSRMLTSLHHSTQGEGYRPDSEYPSGDSIDSTRAEDSGGSDSSSSDVAD